MALHINHLRDALKRCHLREASAEYHLQEALAKYHLGEASVISEVRVAECHLGEASDRSGQGGSCLSTLFYKGNSS